MGTSWTGSGRKGSPARRLTVKEISMGERFNTIQRLIDRHGRVHTNLRLSVTDRCNIRCWYCMPHENVVFKPREEILTFEEIARFCQVMATLGVNKLRLTGGEPLVRSKLPNLIAALASISGIDDLALTTNGILLADQAQALRRAGLTRLNISLDTLSPETFHRLARREGLDQVLRGIDVACAVGFDKIRLNALSLRGVTEPEVVRLVTFARERNLEMRFIEFMPLDAENHWKVEQVLTGQEVLTLAQEAFGPLTPIERDDPSQPATDYAFADGRGRLGLINPVTQPFCHACNRLRLTADGKVRNCLFSSDDWNVQPLLRGNADDEQIAQLVRDCIAAKRPGHGMDEPQFLRPRDAMYQIGG